MAVLCLVFLGLCVKSFIDARIARKQKEAESQDRRRIGTASNDPMQRPPRRRQRIDALRHLRILHQRRRMMRLDAGVDHQRAAAAPVFLPGERADAAMSAAGFERVNVTQRKLFSVRAVNSASSTSTISGNALIASLGPYASQKRRSAGSISDPSRISYRGPCTASTPGKQIARLGESVRQAQIARQLRRQRPARRTNGGEHDLRAFVQAAAGIIQRVDRRARLEVQVARPVDALQQMREESVGCRECPDRGRLPWR